MNFDFNKANGPQLKVLRQGLLDTYKRVSFAMMLMDELDRDYDSLVERGNFEEELFELVLTAKREGWLDDIVEATTNLYPNAPAMRTVFETYALLESAVTRNEPQASAAGVREEDPPVEQLMQQALPSFSSPLLWVEGLNIMRSRVCRVDAGGARGTGCLIGLDLVITCDYVMQKAEERADLEVRFDYVVDRGAAVAGRICKLADDWLVARQPYEPPEDGGAALDFVVMRLAEPVGDDLLAEGAPRGWIKFADGPPPAIGDPVFMLHHPHAGPLMMSTGSILAWDPEEARFATDTKTLPGSGGAPLFNSRFELIGLHESANRTASAIPHRGEVRADLIGTALKALPDMGGVRG